VNEIRENMDRIEARRLQPHYIESFFSGAYQNMKGQIRKRGDKRYSLPHVPARLRERRSPTGVPYTIARETLKRGTVFIDDTGRGSHDRLLFYIEDIIEDGRKDSAGRAVKISHRLHFVEICGDGNVTTVGCAPYLDYTTPTEAEYLSLQKLIADKAWWGQNAEQLARDYAARNLLPAHLAEVKDRRTRYVNK